MRHIFLYSIKNLIGGLNIISILSLFLVLTIESNPANALITSHSYSENTLSTISSSIEQITDIHAYLSVKINDDELIAISDGSVYQTADLKTWEQIGTFPKTLKPMDILKARDGTLYLTTWNNTGSFGWLLSSEDNGRTWVKILKSSGKAFWKVTEDQGDIYVGEYQLEPYNVTKNIWKTTDKGRTWSKVFIGPEGTRHIHMLFVASNGEIYSSIGDSDSLRIVYRSKDKGNTWTQVTNLETFISGLEYENYIYFTGDRGMLGVYRTSLSDGENFEKRFNSPFDENSPLQIFDIWEEDGVFYLAGENPDTILVSPDQGQGWFIIYRHPSKIGFERGTIGGSFKGFFLVHGSLNGDSIKIPKITKQQAVDLLYSLPAKNETNVTLEFKNGELKYLNFHSNNTSIRFIGWEIKNLAPNGDFESGDVSPSDWFAGGTDPQKATWSKERALSGEHSLAITANSTERNFWNTILTNKIKPNKSYTISVNISADRVFQANNAFILLTFIKKDGTESYCTSSWDTVYTSWNRYNVVCETPSDLKATRLLLVNSKPWGDRPVTLYFDNLQIEEGALATEFMRSDSSTTHAYSENSVTLNPSVIINGLKFKYSGMLKDGEVSPWYRIGTFAGLTTFNVSGNFKLQLTENQDARSTSNESDSNTVLLTIKSWIIKILRLLNLINNIM